MRETLDITQTQQNILWGYMGVVALVTTIVIILAVRNIISIYRLGIKKSLILLLYITCICREISNLVQLAVFCKHLYMERGNTNPYSAVSSIFNNGLVIVLILTNYSLHNSMKLICGEISSE